MTDDRRAFVLVYSLSGGAGLVYEVTWTRFFALQLGHTIAAASTVLAAFMGGLAAGAWLAGRRRATDRASSLRLYAALELAVAAAALVLPLALRATFPALGWAYADGEAPARLALARVVISLVLVGIPAAAMGATFPIAAAAMAGAPADAGVLYAANTFGAAIGAIAAGFILVPALGLRGTTWVGVALNVLAACGALWLASRAFSAQPDSRARAYTPDTRSSRTVRPESRRRKTAAHAAAQSAAEPLSPLRPVLASAAAAISGFSALVYEVAWTRLLALVLGPTTYAFATMAASFITGLAIGSAIGTRVARRTARPVAWLGILLIAGALAATVSAWYAATRLPLVVAVQVADPSAEFFSVVWRQALLVGLLMLPMTLALGALFPMALAAVHVGADGRGATDASQSATPATVASVAARVYAANTLGAIAGALVAGFALVPQLGLRETVRAAAALSMLSGAVMLVAAGGYTTRAARAATALAVALAVLFVTPPWDRALLASGAYKYAPYLGAGDIATVLRAGTLRYYKEGAAGTVSVRDLGGTRSLAIDGKVDASNAGDMLTQRLLGLLPVLIHGNAGEVAVIGLGSGVTAGSVLAAGATRRLDVLEISREVVEASHLFDAENGSALSHPGVRLVVGDGRSHLLLTSRSYDVIVSEPSNPWMAGVASLFTQEFFEAAKARLKPGGLLCQWAHTYDIGRDDLRSIVRTFSTVFPEGTMWLVGGGDLLLIGARDGEIVERLHALSTGARAASVAKTLTDVGASPGAVPFTLLSLYAGGPRELAAFAADAPVQTDDRTGLEFSAPRGIYGRSREDNAEIIRALTVERPVAVADAFVSATDGDWTSRGQVDLRAQAFTSAYEAFRHAVTLNSRNPVALAGFSDAAGGVGRLPEERDWLQAIAAREPSNAAVRVELSRVLAVTGDTAGAVRTAGAALELAPDDPRAAEQLASVLADAGDAERLGPFAEAFLARFPDRADARYYQASALFMRGRTEDALSAARQVVAAHPDHARAQNLLGTTCAALGRRDCAQHAFDASIRGNPRDAVGYVNAGLFNLQVANPKAAESYFANALAIDPSSAAARAGLEQVREQLRQR
jgi:spermidine synthase